MEFFDRRNLWGLAEEGEAPLRFVEPDAGAFSISWSSKAFAAGGQRPDSADANDPAFVYVHYVSGV